VPLFPKGITLRPAPKDRGRSGFNGVSGQLWSPGSSAEAECSAEVGLVGLVRPAGLVGPEWSPRKRLANTRPSRAESQAYGADRVLALARALAQRSLRHGSHSEWLPFGLPGHTSQGPQISSDQPARPAGFEPATRCLEGTFEPSRDVALCRSMRCLPAATVAGRRLASSGVCHVGSPFGSLDEVSITNVLPNEKAPVISVGDPC
jgi:hypothetical protein